MYGWIWRHLPGNLLARSVQALVLVVVVAALLFFVVFPRIQHWLPWNDVSVDHGSSTNASAVAAATVVSDSSGGGAH